MSTFFLQNKPLSMLRSLQILRSFSLQLNAIRCFLCTTAQQTLNSIFTKKKKKKLQWCNGSLWKTTTLFTWTLSRVHGQFSLFSSVPLEWERLDGSRVSWKNTYMQMDSWTWYKLILLIPRISHFPFSKVVPVPSLLGHTKCVCHILKKTKNKKT